ncbi:chymotrypsin-2-like [Bradysia coprophila]|uniref:chymotrypsin-2-like n=1 Tax=Bradysia coprophila TaxID=38358 RepID=UPI00187D966C|nr:chymotrypsin-2-like [Bradysia coprophila]
MFNRHFSVLCLLAIFAYCSPSRADVLSKSTEQRLLGAANAPTNTNSNSVASVRYLTSQLSQHVCGGFIINKHWIGTAAQCLTGKTVNNTVVAVGRPTISGGTIHSVDRIVMHENYDSVTFADDVGLLRTATEIIFSAAVQLIPLGAPILTSYTANMYGWGRITAAGGLSETMRMHPFTTVDRATCLSRFPVVARKFITERHICFWNNVGATCPGDAGGPIIFNDAVVGIISWVEPCVAGQTTVNTRISSYINWITSFTNDDN